MTLIPSSMARVVALCVVLVVALLGNAQAMDIGVGACRDKEVVQNFDVNRVGTRDRRQLMKFDEKCSEPLSVWSSFFAVHGPVVRDRSLLAVVRAEWQVRDGGVHPQRHDQPGRRQEQHGGRHVSSLVSPSQGAARGAAGQSDSVLPEK